MRRRGLFRNVNQINTTPNTFIGGVASTINTPELLAERLYKYPQGTFLASDIYDFEIVGDGIKCFIGIEYYLGPGSFSNNTNITYFIGPENLKMITSNAFASLSASNYRILFFPGVVEIPKQVDGFLNTQQLKRLYLPKCITYGTDRLNNNIFPTSISNATIYADPSMQTINAGAEEGDLAYARSRGAIIRYVLNLTPPSSITDLTYSAGTLNFTSPASANALDFYEVWVNGIYKQEITGSGAAITLNTGDKVEVYACDIYYNRSKSNQITI